LGIAIREKLSDLKLPVEKIKGDHATNVPGLSSETLLDSLETIKSYLEEYIKQANVAIEAVKNARVELTPFLVMK